MKNVVIGLVVISVVVGIAILAFTLAGCESRAVQLERIGLLGEHELYRQPEKTTLATGRWYFLGSGSLESGPALTFYWKSSSGITPTTLSLSMFRIVIDDSKETPTVEFVFGRYWLNLAVMPFTESEKTNLNVWLSERNITDERFLAVIVRISTSDLEKEPFLPK